jgi:hypothetical protein
MNTEDNFTVEDINSQYLFSTHEILVDNSLKSLNTPEGLKAYAAKTLKRIMGDEVTVSSVKLKRPGLISKLASKKKGKNPQARLYVITKF